MDWQGVKQKNVLIGFTGIIDALFAKGIMNFLLCFDQLKVRGTGELPCTIEPNALNLVIIMKNRGGDTGFVSDDTRFSFWGINQQPYNY